MSCFTDKVHLPTESKQTFAWMCHWMTDLQSSTSHHNSLVISFESASRTVCSLPALVTRRFCNIWPGRFSLAGRDGPESTHPETFLSAQVRRGNSAQMCLQTKEKLEGLEVDQAHRLPDPRTFSFLASACCSYSPFFFLSADPLDVASSWLFLQLPKDTVFSTSPCV